MFWPFIKIVAVVTVAAGLTYALRHFVIEPGTMHARCVADMSSALCTVRQAVIWAIDRNAFSVASLILGLLALVLRYRSFGYLGLSLGVAGALLYRIELAGLGLLLGAIALARPRLAQEHARTQGEAQ